MRYRASVECGLCQEEHQAWLVASGPMDRPLTFRYTCRRCQARLTVLTTRRALAEVDHATVYATKREQKG